jgi:MATE family multidrug resistance protein
MSLGFAFCQRPIFALLTDLPTVTALLEEYIWWLVLLPLVAAPSYLLDGVFIGAARTRPMMVTMLISLLGVYLPCWHLTREMENHGLWLAFTLFNLSRGVTLGAWYWHLNKRQTWF